MSDALIGRIKQMVGRDDKFRHAGSTYPWCGKANNLMPAWACIHILRKECWSNFQWIPLIGCWRAVNPEGQTVDMSLSTLRWLAVHAVYDNERNRQKRLDNTVNT